LILTKSPNAPKVNVLPFVNTVKVYPQNLIGFCNSIDYTTNSFHSMLLMVNDDIQTKSANTIKTIIYQEKN